MGLKIGEIIIFKEDFETKTALTKEKVTIKKGEQALIIGKGENDRAKIKFIKGKNRGKIQLLPEKTERINYRSMACVIGEEIYNYVKLAIDDKFIMEDVDANYIAEIIEDYLTDML
ncbi:MAG: hypothetical protein ACOCRX_09780 [Candidatus Woesearchaeota archaeon]